MQSLAIAAVLIVALFHSLIAIVEMFFWKLPRVYKRLERFGFSQDEANKVAPIVANAGLYNAFMAAGLLWSVLANNTQAALFFLSCVALAGLYGAATLKRTTLILQTLPAALAALAIWSAAVV
jgi:putative membrane protein